MNAVQQWQVCRTPDCQRIGPWSQYCPDHTTPAALVLACFDTNEDQHSDDAEPLPCTRCRSPLAIAPGALLCTACARDQRRAELVPSDDQDDRRRDPRNPD